MAEADLAGVSVVIPAYNAERTLGRVLDAIAAQPIQPAEVIVVDDGSTDATAAVAERHGARVLRGEHRGYVGGARNRGWAEARGDVVVFLDADVVPASSWATGLARALREFPGAIVGCARAFTSTTPWGWVAHLQVETPYLRRGRPRDVPFVSSFCLAVPRDLSIRFDESYGGEDALFSADAAAAGMRLVFDPRFYALHEHGRSTFADLRRQQRRLAYGLARCAAVQREGLHKRFFARLPIHYFLLARLALIYGRVKDDAELRPQFLRLLPHLVVAEWTLGASAVRYAVQRPSLRGQDGRGFR